ncbi:hypothetical protein [Ruficoccus sp. ZRK36]|uniref:hypothetical protein n=1 Tax=Ruficoccus sp. ZRK36 TaxID=2866311 RepID=UPI001C73308C|nr:hypothetical protein [Ruficoccus sp. ZRK36]QYY34818.1 hypothetical protein K0V07_10955 [Ruficoccus sp. ZRK36]
MKFILIIFLLLLPFLAHADVEVSLGTVESTFDKSQVQLTAKNTFDQGIRDARVWVFLVDGNGKVVGNKAAWVIGGNDHTADNENLPKSRAPLQPDEEREFTVMIDHTPSRQGSATSPASDTLTPKIVFIRLILADGSTVNPKKAVRPQEQE